MSSNPDHGDEFSVSRSRSGTLPRRLTMGSSNFGLNKPANAPTGLWSSSPSTGSGGTLKRPSLLSSPGQVPLTPSSVGAGGTLGRNSAILPSHLSMNLGGPPPSNPKADEVTLTKEAQEEEQKLIAKEKLLSWDDKQRMKDTAVKVREEILSTEKAYVDHLKLFCNVYAKSFDRPEVCKLIGIDISQKTALVSNIELLSNFHIQFLIDLEAGGLDDVENVFIKYSAFFRMYSTYMSNYQKCVDTLQGLRTNKPFQEHMNGVYAQLGGDLMSFMIRPVQRVPRYVLLLRELRRQTLPSSASFRTINIALSKISDTAMHINNAKRQIENMNTLFSLQERIGGDFGDLTLLLPYRHLIAENEFIFREAKKGFFGTIKESPRILFLFNDIILWTNKNMEFKNFAHIVSVRLESIDETHFQMQNSSFHIVVKCASKQEKDDWVQKITNQHQEQMRNRHQKLAVRRNVNSTHEKIISSFATLNSYKEAENQRQLALQNEESVLGNEVSRLSISDNGNAPPSPTPTPPSASRLSTSAPPAAATPTADAPNAAYRPRLVQPRALRSGRTTAGPALLDKFSDLGKPNENA